MKENVVFFFWVAEIWGSCNQFCWYYEIQRKELFFIRDVLKISPRRGRKSGRNVVGGQRKDRKEGCCVVAAKWDDDDDDDEEHEGQQKKEKKYANGIVGIVLIAVFVERVVSRVFVDFPQIPTNVYSLKVLNI